MAKTPNYVLSKEFQVYRPSQSGGSITLEAGTFVRPVSFDYVPAELKAKHPYSREDYESFCYTPKGFFLIPNHLFREV